MINSIIMRKLKLQMHISLDGFVAGINNAPTNFNWDNELRKHSISNLEHVDAILLGSKTAVNFIPYWASVAEKPENPDYAVGKLITDIPKIVFSQNTTTSNWKNATMANGDLVAEVKKLKTENGNDMMVYGGVDFVSSLISEDLIDEYHLLFEPMALGCGRPIFKQNTNLKLVKTTSFSCGVLVLQYAR
jgi:dihydrofolate reductase